LPADPQTTARPPLNLEVPLDEEARRLLWRCRRGMKELDVLLERFARRELPGASAEQRHTFTRFLELPDPVLVDFLLGQAIPPDPELAGLVARIAGQAMADRASSATEPMAVAAPLRHDLAPKRRL
jgi:antitoxin CptB